MNKLNRYIVALVAISFLIPIFKVQGKGNATQQNISEADRRKAEYIYFEAHNQKELINNAENYELLKYAHNIDPTNTAISYHLGLNTLLCNNCDSAKMLEGISLMKKHVDAVPTDYMENYTYANICNHFGMSNEAFNTLLKLDSIFPYKTEIKVQLADTYASRGDFKKAIELYDSIESIEGKTYPISFKKMIFFKNLNDTVSSIAEAHKLVNAYPTSAENRQFLANVYYIYNMKDSAFQTLDIAEKLDSTNCDIPLMRAYFYSNEGDSINYENETYKALINKNFVIEDKLDILTDYIKKKLAQRDSTQRIEQLFKVLVDQNPHEKNIHDLYCEYLVTKKDYKAAAEQLSYAIDMDPTNDGFWKRLMFIYLMDNNYNKAVEAGDKALEYNSDNIQLYQYIAPAYSQMKKYDKALEVYNKALTVTDSTNVGLYASLFSGKGDVYYAMGDTAKALEIYEKAYQLNPFDASILNNYAYFLTESNGDLQKAERMSSNAVKIEPNNPVFLDTYAWVFFKKGEYKLALTYMNSAMSKLDKDSMSAEYYGHLGDILFMNGQPAEALANWEKALKLSPDSDLLKRKVKFKTYFYK